MSERSGIEIDYCPECRGIWLDRGELDKIVDRIAAEAPAAPAAPAPAQPPYDQPQYDRPQHDRPQRAQPQYGDRQQQPYRKKKKEHWLMEMFD